MKTQPDVLETQILEKILSGIQNLTGLKKENICHCGRKRESAEARFILCYVATEYFKLSEAKVGDFIGKDHSTVSVGRKRALELASIDPQYSTNINYLTSQFWEFSNFNLEF